jgi:predicted transcriptional regulator
MAAGRLPLAFAGHISYKLCMSTKEILQEVADKLPPDATLVDAICELEFRQAVEDGLASLDQGERIPLEEARKRIPQWISKYSSRAKPGAI